MTFDIHAALPAALADRAGAWEFVRAFAADRARAIGPADGYTPAELDASAARLGVPLPAALRELYGLLGRRTDLTSNHDVLLPPDKLYVEDGLLVFREENQGVAWWGVRPDGDDPEVSVSFSMAEPVEEPWSAWLHRFSLAAVEIVLSETLLFDDDLVEAVELDTDDLDLLPEAMRELAFPGYPESESAGNRIRWFAGPDLLGRHDGTMIVFRARTEDDQEAFFDAVCGPDEDDEDEPDARAG